MTKKDIEEQIKALKIEMRSQGTIISEIEARDPNDGNLSFEYYQLHAMKKQLKELEVKLKEVSEE